MTVDFSEKHMYTPSKMARNLGKGDIGEAFFRYWYETNVHGLQDLILKQFGYNPEGIIVGEEKVKKLKQLERSTDYAIYKIDDIREDPEGANPILGISINSQNEFFSMIQSRAAKMPYKGGIWGCYNCPRGADCFNEAENIWFNEYNISNDYKLFHDEFKTEVVMITLISRIPNTVWNGKVKDGKYASELREYLVNGHAAIARIPSIIEFLDYLIFKGSNRKNPRNYEMLWIKYSDILNGSIEYHITGAPVSRGLPRPVACIDKAYASSEQELIKFIEGYSVYGSSKLHQRWYAEVRKQGRLK